MNKKYLDLLHRRIANTSVGPSTARGMGPKGTIKSARDFLCRLSLHRLKVKNQSAFRGVLDQMTKELQTTLPLDAQHWGSARKFLNIFIRNVFYNKYLCEHCDIGHLESWLEVPLDSHVAKGLKGELGGKNLPRWRTVIGLQPKVNKIYQDFALKVAVGKGTYRVHLDLLYWRGAHLKIKN